MKKHIDSKENIKNDKVPSLSSIPDSSKKPKTNEFYTFENLYKWTFFVYIILIGIMIKELINIENYYEANGFERSDMREYFFVFLGIFISSGIFEIIKFSLTSFARNNMTKISKRIETKDQKVVRIINMFNSITYYTFATVINFIIIRKYAPDHLPTNFGGTLDVTQFRENWPKSVAFPVRVFFMISIGHHIERTLEHLKNHRDAKNFWIMILHHVLTINLMVNCFGHREFLFGIPVLMIHDITDIAVGMTRVVREIEQWIKFTIPCYLVLLSLWFYTRNYVFNFEIVYPLLTEEMFKFYNHGDVNHMFATLGLTILMFLNTYWLWGALYSGYVKIFLKKEDLAHFEGEKMISDSKQKLE